MPVALLPQLWLSSRLRELQLPQGQAHFGLHHNRLEIGPQALTLGASSGDNAPYCTARETGTKWTILEKISATSCSPDRHREVIESRPVPWGMARDRSSAGRWSAHDVEKTDGLPSTTALQAKGPNDRDQAHDDSRLRSVRTARDGPAGGVKPDTSGR